MPPTYKGATEQEFQAWEKLLDEGTPAYVAAQEVGTTLTRLAKGDSVRKQKGMELAKERQAAKVEQVVESQAVRPEPSPAIVTAWARANHPDYADKTQVEISGPDGGPIAVEGRAVVGLADVAAIARRL